MEAALFAGVAVSDFDRAVAWFEALLGEPATFEAHDTERCGTWPSTGRCTSYSGPSAPATPW